jgi:hypothetical protein
LSALADLKSLVGRDEQMASLQSKLPGYWEGFDPLFDWTPTAKFFRSANCLRREVVPRREAALAIVRQIEELNHASLVAQRQEVATRYTAFRNDLQRLLWQTMLGTMRIACQPGRGTRLVVHLPLPTDVIEAPLARIAG